MLYGEFINKAINSTVVEAENGLFYLEPLWKSILNDNALNITKISDFKTSWADVESVLKLEVEKRNAINSKKELVVDWIYTIIATQVEPAIMSEETDYVKAVTEFIKQNHESQQTLQDNDWKNFKST